MQNIFDLIISFEISEIFLILILVLNILTFLLYVLDKRKAARGKWRISEATLIFFTLAFGGVGAFLGMKLARHKTKHIKFKIAVVFGLIITLVPIVYIVCEFIGRINI